MSHKRTGTTPTTRDLVFAFLVRYKREHDGSTPSTREIAKACCLSVSTVHYHLLNLEIEDRIRVSGERRRNIEIVGGTWALSGSGETPDQQITDATPERDQQ
jgi:hypothetical protein